MNKLAATFGVGFVVLGLLSRCAEEPASAPSPSVSASVTTEPTDTGTPGHTGTPSPTGTPEPTTTTPAIRPAITDLVVTPTGLGPLVVGQPVPDVPADAAIVAWNPTYCVEEPAAPTEPYAGAWLSVYGPSPLGYSGPGEPFVTVTEDGLQGGVVGAIRVLGSQLATEEGIAPGSTRAQLEAAYPSFDSIVRGPLSDVYVINGSDGGALWFEVSNAGTPDPDYWESFVDLVLWINIVPGNEPAAPLAGSDAGGPCVV
jgi:hypothetical protein